ncbi:MAG TPA: low molecular weight phosphatase family protein [archaeon]|nr:low molecular weight phosphatase family protein [archaeon]
MKRVIFVCMSNSRRSIMAEAIFDKLTGPKAQSAGIDPKPADQNTFLVLKEIGIDCKGKSKKVTEAMLEQADKIITFRCAEHIPEKYHPKVQNWDFGAKRQVGEEQKERTLEYMRELRDSIYEKVKELIGQIG